MENVGIFYGHLIHFLSIWLCCTNLVFFPVLVYCVKKNLAALIYICTRTYFCLLRSELNYAKLFGTNRDCQTQVPQMQQTDNR
jgi:hypothetical protein